MWKPCHDILIHIASFPLEIYIVLPNTVTNSLLLVSGHVMFFWTYFFGARRCVDTLQWILKRKLTDSCTNLKCATLISETLLCTLFTATKSV